MKAFTEFLADYYKTKEKVHVRMGQHFLNNICCVKVWPELFYQEDDKVSERIIYKLMQEYQWLDHSYEGLKQLTKDKREGSQEV